MLKAANVKIIWISEFLCPPGRAQELKFWHNQDTQSQMIGNASVNVCKHTCVCMCHMLAPVPAHSPSTSMYLHHLLMFKLAERARNRSDTQHSILSVEVWEEINDGCRVFPANALIFLKWSQRFISNETIMPVWKGWGECKKKRLFLPPCRAQGRALAPSRFSKQSITLNVRCVLTDYNCRIHKETVDGGELPHCIGCTPGWNVRRGLGGSLPTQTNRHGGRGRIALFHPFFYSWLVKSIIRSLV